MSAQKHSTKSHLFLKQFDSFRKNIILSQVVEERKVDSLVYNPDVESRTLSAKRTLGQAMIPGPRLVKVEVSKKIYESCVTTAISDSQTNE